MVLLWYILEISFNDDNKTEDYWSWRDGVVVMSIDFSSGRRVFGSQHLHESSLLSVTPVPLKKQSKTKTKNWVPLPVVWVF